MKRGKKYLSIVQNLKNNEELASPYKAIKWIKDNHFANFDESVDVSINLGVDPRKAEQIVRGTIVLPNGTGKAMRVLVIAQGDKATEGKMLEQIMLAGKN